MKFNIDLRCYLFENSRKFAFKIGYTCVSDTFFVSTEGKISSYPDMKKRLPQGGNRTRDLSFKGSFRLIEVWLG